MDITTSFLLMDIAKLLYYGFIIYIIYKFIVAYMDFYLEKKQKQRIDDYYKSFQKRI